MRQPTVSMYLIRLLCELMAARGVTPQAFRHHVGISELELARDDARLDLGRYRRARRLLEQTCGLEEFFDRPPFNWQHWMTCGWPELASLWVNSPSLGAAMQAYTRYRPLIGEADAVGCHIEGDSLVLSYTPDLQAGPCLMPVVSHFTMLLDMVAHYRARLGMLFAVRIELGELGRPVSVPELSDVLQAPLAFCPGTVTHRLVLQGAAVWAAVSDYHQLSSEWAARSLNAQLQTLQQSAVGDLLVQRIEAIILAYWHAVGASADAHGASALQSAVAHTLGLSRWTLRRKLAARGTTFSALLDQLRARRLAELLATPHCTLMEIGISLGFQTQSAFSKYFRQRHGHAPSHDARRAGAR